MCSLVKDVKQDDCAIRTFFARYTRHASFCSCAWLFALTAPMLAWVQPLAARCETTGRCLGAGSLQRIQTSEGGGAASLCCTHSRLPSWQWHAHCNSQAHALHPSASATSSRLGVCFPQQEPLPPTPPPSSRWMADGVSSFSCCLMLLSRLTLLL